MHSMSDDTTRQQPTSSPPPRKNTLAVVEPAGHRPGVTYDDGQDGRVLTATDTSHTALSPSCEACDDTETVVAQACTRSPDNEASTLTSAVRHTATPREAVPEHETGGCAIAPACSVSCATDEASTATSSTDQRPRRPTRAFASATNVACETERAGSSAQALPSHAAEAASVTTAAAAEAATATETLGACLDKDVAATMDMALAASKPAPQIMQELLEAADTTYSATIPQCLYTRYMNTELADSLVAREAQPSVASATVASSHAASTPAGGPAVTGVAATREGDATERSHDLSVSGVAHVSLSSVSSLHDLLVDEARVSFLARVGATAAAADAEDVDGAELQDAIGLTTSLHTPAQVCVVAEQEGGSRRGTKGAQMTSAAGEGDMPRGLHVFHAPSLPRPMGAAWAAVHGDAADGQSQKEAVTRLESLSHVQRIVEDEQLGVADRTPSRLVRRRLKRTGKHHHHHHRLPPKHAAKSPNASQAELAVAAEAQEGRKSHHGHRRLRRRRRQQTGASGRSGPATPSQPCPAPPSSPRPASSPRQASLAAAEPPSPRRREAPATILVPHPPASMQPAQTVAAKEDGAIAAAAAMAGSALVAVLQLRQGRPTPTSPQARRRSNVSLISAGSQPRSVPSHRDVVPCETGAPIAAPAASHESKAGASAAEKRAVAQPPSHHPRRGQRRHQPHRAHNSGGLHSHRHHHPHHSSERPLHSSPRSRHARHSQGRRRGSGASSRGTQGHSPRSRSAMSCPGRCTASSLPSPSAMSRLTSATTTRSYSRTVTTSLTASSSYTLSSSFSSSSSSSSASSSSLSSSGQVVDLPLKSGCTVPPPPEVFVDLTCRLRRLSELQHYAELACIYEWDVTWGVWDRVETYVVLGSAAFAKGNMRASYYMIDLKRPTCRLVAKRYLKASVEEGQYFDDAAMYAIAGHWARLFNSLQPPKCVKFVPAAVLQLPNRVPPLTLAMEPMLEGTFRKYNNNYGYVPHDVRWTPQAFSHFTYHASHHELMITDIQGVGDIYTDPQILSADGEGYGKGNLGCSGMRRFIRSHRCNPVCQALHLPAPTVPRSRRHSHNTHRTPHHGRRASRHQENRPRRHHREGSRSVSHARPEKSTTDWPPSAAAAPVEREAAASDGEEPYLFPARLCAERLPPKLYQRHHLKWTTSRTNLAPGEAPSTTVPPSLRVTLAAETTTMLTTATPPPAPIDEERQKSFGADAIARIDTSCETTRAGVTGSSVTGNGSASTTARTTSASPQAALGVQPGANPGGHATTPFFCPHPPTTPYAISHPSTTSQHAANASVRGGAGAMVVYDSRFVPPQLRQAAAQTPLVRPTPAAPIVGGAPDVDGALLSTMVAANYGLLPSSGPTGATPRAALHVGPHLDGLGVVSPVPARHDVDAGTCATQPPATQTAMLPRVSVVRPPAVPVFSAMEIHPPRRRS